MRIWFHAVVTIGIWLRFDGRLMTVRLRSLRSQWRRLHWPLANSGAAAHRFQVHDACLPVPVRPCCGLSGRRLSTRHRLSCRTTAFCWHSNARCQPDVQQFWRQDFAAAGTRVWNSLPSDLRQPGLSYGQFRRSFKTFLFGQWGHGAVWALLTAPSRNILTYLLTPQWRPAGRGML